MNPLRYPNFLLTLLIAAAVVAMEMVLKAAIFPVILWVLLVAHLFLNFRLPGKPRLLTTILLTVPFAVWYRYLPRGGMTGSEFAPIDLLLIIGCYTLSLGVYHLLTIRTGGSSNQAFGASIIAVALAGTATRDKWFLVLVVVFMVLVILYMREANGLATLRRGRAALWRLALAATVLAVLTCGMEFVVTGTLPRFNRWLANRLLEGSLTSGTGFRRTARLGSVSDFWAQAGAQDVMIRHWRETTGLPKNPPLPRGADAVAAGSGVPSPGESVNYLRGAVFNVYDARGAWHSIKENSDLASRDSDRGRSLFYISEMNQSQRDSLEVGGTIYPARELGEAFFLPAGVQQIGAFADHVLVGPALTVVATRRSQPSGGYAYYEPRRGMPGPPDGNDLQIPPWLVWPLRRIAAGVTDPKATPHENAVRLAAYFQKNFRYHIGLQLSHHKDPVLEFLEDIRAGHCEYFASAGVLLLRAINVPARYVTGFVCEEESIGGFYRIARRKDAHAWVEFYEPGRGWITFDPTPSNARPATEPTSRGERFVELLGAWWDMVTSVMASGGLLGAVGLMWSGLVQLILAVPLVVWGVLILLALVWIYRRAILGWFGHRRDKAATPRIKLLRAKLHRAERLLAPHGVTRDPATPVGAFLHRVQGSDLPVGIKDEAGALLAEYHAQRFRPE